MPRPVTLFTGQWADLSLPTLAEKASEMGYDGLELACWGDHFDVDKAAISKKYCQERWEILSDNGLTAFSISSHLVGQAVCDLIDERHKAILPPDVWGEGNPEKVRRRAAKKLAKTAKACRNFINAKPGRGKKDDFPAVVNGFTGSSIWHSIYAFPPTDQDYWNKGFDDFAKRFGPILDAFDKQNVNFALEVHPTEIAFDIARAERALAAAAVERAAAEEAEAEAAAAAGCRRARRYLRITRTRRPAGSRCRCTCRCRCRCGAARRRANQATDFTAPAPRRPPSV